MSKRQAIKIPFLFLCITLALGYFFVQNARAETLPLKSYTTSDGLAHDHVNRIVRDSRGFLWFCTSEGLSRFDGYEFKNYTQDDGLPHRGITDFLETRSGNLWIGTGDGVVLFNPLGKSARETTDNQNEPPMFRTFRPAEIHPEPTTWYALDLLEDREGTVWVASQFGLYRLEKTIDDWQLQRFDVPPAAADRNEGFTDLMEDHTGAIWAGTEFGYYRILPDRLNFQTVKKNLRVQSFLEDREHRVWVGSGGMGAEGRGLLLYSFAGDEPRLERIFDKKDGLVSDNWMNALLETSDGRILVANGLCEYTPQADKNAPQFRILSTEGVSDLAEDGSGNLWFSTENGVRRMMRNGFVNFDETDGLKGKHVNSIITDSDGDIFVLSSEKTISRFNGKGFDTIAPLKMIQPNWGTGQITFRDSRGEWWVEGVEGLQRYPKTNRFEDLARTAPLKTYTTRDGLFSNGVFRLFEDSRGDIWISVLGDINDMLLRWERATETIHRYTTDDNLPFRNGATAFGEDRAGNIWIGFYGGGLVRFHSGKFESFGKDDGLPPGFIYHIFTDSAGRVWVATSAGGVVRIDNPTGEEKPRLEILTTRNGLSSNQALCITEDNFGRIYIGTGRGINRLDLATSRIKIFTKTDGLRESSVSVCRRDTSGALWFGSWSSLARYTPTAEETSEPPPIFIAGLRVNGETVKKLSELGERTVEDLDFSSDQRQIQIDFLALGFGAGETLRYQYKLDGVDADWSEPTTQRNVNFNLSPGGYRFLVRAVNADGAASENPARVSFSIARPVWQRWWFLALAALAVSLVIYAVYRYRLRRLLELEKVRTRIATDLHDDIGASLSKISILSEIVGHRVAQIAPDDSEISEPLGSIAGTSREMVDSMSDIVWAINPAKDHLSDLIQRMRNLAGEMTELRDIHLQVHLAGIENADLALGADLRREVYLIFKESLNNMVKHSDCDRAEIEFRREAENLIITIKDDGKGFDLNAINGDGTRGGNGLPNMRRRAANLGGSFEIFSEIGKGTTAVLRVPLKSGKLNLRKFFRNGK
jgi:signal transduction histidine kinase/ligand-binding sensor domain-containing protein